MCRKSRPANSFKFVCNEGSKTAWYLDPGAEYMSKIGEGKEKNAKAVSGSQLPVARKTLGACGVFTENWQLGTGNCL